MQCRKETCARRGENLLEMEFSSRGEGKGRRRICKQCDALERNQRRTVSLNLKLPKLSEEVIAHIKDSWEMTGDGRVSVSKTDELSYSFGLTRKKPSVLESIETWAESIFKGYVPPLPAECVFIRRPENYPERYVNLVLSDLHFGSDIIGKRTGGQSFGPVEESRRFTLIVKNTCEYKLDHRKESKLRVLLLGDIIQNQLHDKRDGDLLALQAARAIHLLIQGISTLANEFPEVEVHCVTGNHGRFTEVHQKRAVLHKFNSLETVIYYAVKSACASLKNVTFHIPETPFAAIDQFGHRIFATHGDTVLTPGNPGKAIKIESLEHQINRINATLPDAQEYGVFIVGHVHIPSLTYLPNGAIMMTNGCLLPVDEFAVSIGLMEQRSGQWLFESTPEYIVGDCRLLRVPKETDTNEALDRIIKPWKKL